LEEVKIGAKLERLFNHSKNGGCGFYAINVILMMFDKEEVFFSFSRKKGISSKKLILELRKAGLVVASKTISARNLKPRSILWYPKPIDHYVVIGEVADGRVLIYDSERKGGPKWHRLSYLKKKWYKWYSDRYCGWVVEVKEK